MTMAAWSIDEPRSFEHASVMVDEVINALAPVDGGVYADVTLGGGGHAEALLRRSPHCRLFGFDRDPDAVEAARLRLAEFQGRVSIVQATFDELAMHLASRGIRRLDGIMADLGLSSPQLDRAERGMSFRTAGPIDMRMDPTQGETALSLITRLEQDELADLIYELGEERASRRIARCIKQSCQKGELRTTLDLRRAVVRAVGPRRIGGVDPATRTFQALRMAVNSELEQLDRLLELAADLLVDGGVLAVISFHSLEDRRVKRTMAERPTWEKLTKKPILPTETEAAQNPRARSAKLRTARRVRTGNTPLPPEVGDP